MSDVSHYSGFARRYALALYELAEDSSIIEKVFEELQILKKVINESRDFVRLIKNPVFGRDDQANGVLAVANNYELCKTLRNFLGLLAQNRRLFALPEIINSFESIYSSRNGQLTVEVTSAINLTDTQLQSLTETLEKCLGSKIEMVTKTAPDILGGLTVSMGSKMFDSSIKSKIKRLGLSMKGSA